MKKGLVFLFGVITGVVLTFVICGILFSSNNRLSGITLYEEPGEIIQENSLKVFQTLDNGMALASDKWDNITVLLWCEEGQSFYDDQVLKASKDECFRQIGLYRYRAKTGMKTIPVVAIEKK
ncbi:hypothetical protein SAMN06298215_0207 [Bacteroidales bacterium WCE2008]|nr:hypothetical protein SAMN06298215_0207 [Bacteroidales bacterium WCE2008]